MELRGTNDVWENKQQAIVLNDYHSSQVSFWTLKMELHFISDQSLNTA